MIVSIGMLAWNEESGIASTIRSLFQQTVFTPESPSQVERWELIVVPNGCTDKTARVAKEAIAECLSALNIQNCDASVIELKTPGKSNAWNQFIHEFSRKDADLILMVDADIEFGEPDTILNSVNELHENRSADVVVDLPLKDILKKEKKSFLERISIAVSNDRLKGQVGIAGSFYCGRASVLRGIWMPIGLPGEDGFLKAMIITDLFRSEVDLSRLVRVKGASHYYEAELSFSAIFHHELRLVMGAALNCYFTWDFLRFATDPKGDGAGVLIRRCLENDPNWYKNYINNEIRNRGFWVLPRGILFRRFSTLSNVSAGNRVAKLPVAFMAFLFDLVVFFVANRLLKRGRGIGFW